MADTAPQPQPTPQHHPHSLGGKIAGMLVFAIGVGLLLLVFYLAYVFFTGLATALGAPASANPAQSPSLLTVLAKGVLQLGMLFLMGYVGSLIASKGLELFGVSRGVSAK
jgi:hypothetical protein